MAEEFLQGGVVVCGESWSNSWLPFNSFGWATKMEMETSSATHHHWNQDFLPGKGRWEEINSNLLLEYGPQTKNSDSSLNSMMSSSACAETGLSTGLPLTSDYALSLLQTFLDTDFEPQINNSNGFLWNSTPAACNNVHPNFLPSPQSHFTASSLTTNHKPHFHTMPATAKHHEEDEEEEDKDVLKRPSHGPTCKRQRIGTPSPMPTFKVRKEKLGDRITALQQLVSPFGKTDTASVLHEVIEYIEFLHDQIKALSAPYLKHGSPLTQQRQQGAEKARDEQVVESRGVCLVPISTTFPFASETDSDFWTPTFGPR